MTIQIFSTALTCINTIAILSVGWWLPKLYQHSLDKKIVKYKLDLETVKEKQLFEFNKSITGFNKFFDKKYEIYPKLYSELIKVHGEVSNWAPTQWTPDFNKLTDAVFKDYINTFSFSIPDKRELVTKRKEKTFNISDFFRLLPGHFKMNVTNVRNNFQNNRLFLSEESESLIIQVLDNFYKSQSGYYWIFEASNNNEDKWDEIVQTNNANSLIIKRLLHTMRLELENKIIEKTAVNS